MHISRIITFMLILALPFSFGCRKWQNNYKRNRDARELERKQREKEKETLARYEEAIKHQADIQSPKARKAMKQKYKQAYRYNHHKKEFFLKRWFTPKKRRTVPVKPE
jgi:ABC-type multidrug transport system fused ATPase/permease subunit